MFNFHLIGLWCLDVCVNCIISFWYFVNWNFIVSFWVDLIHVWHERYTQKSQCNYFSDIHKTTWINCILQLVNRNDLTIKKNLKKSCRVSERRDLRVYHQKSWFTTTLFLFFITSELVLLALYHIWSDSPPSSLPTKMKHWTDQ